MISVYRGRTAPRRLTTPEKLQAAYLLAIGRMRGYREVRPEELIPPRDPTILFSRVLEMEVTMGMRDRFAKEAKRMRPKSRR